MPREGNRQDLPEDKGSDSVAEGNADSSSQNNRQPSVLDEESESEEEPTLASLLSLADGRKLLHAGHDLFALAKTVSGPRAAFLYSQAIRKFEQAIQGVGRLLDRAELARAHCRLAESLHWLGSYFFNQAEQAETPERQAKLCEYSREKYNNAIKQCASIGFLYERSGDARGFISARVNLASTYYNLGLVFFLQANQTHVQEDVKQRLYKQALEQFQMANEVYNKVIAIPNVGEYDDLTDIFTELSRTTCKRAQCTDDLEQKVLLCDEAMEELDRAENDCRAVMARDYGGSSKEREIISVRTELAYGFYEIGSTFFKRALDANGDAQVLLYNQAMTRLEKAEEWYRTAEGVYRRHNDRVRLRTTWLSLLNVLYRSGLALCSRAESTKDDLEREIFLCDSAVKRFDDAVSISRMLPVAPECDRMRTKIILELFVAGRMLFDRGCVQAVPIEQAVKFLAFAERLYSGAVSICERFGDRNNLKVGLFHLGGTVTQIAATKNCFEAQGRYGKEEIRGLYERAIGYLMRSATLCISLDGADDAEQVTEEFLELPDVEIMLRDVRNGGSLEDEGPVIIDIEGFKRTQQVLATTFYELGQVLLEQAQQPGNERQMIDLFELSAERLSTAERMLLILHNDEACHTNERYLAPVLQRLSSRFLGQAERAQHFDEATQLFERAAKRVDELGLALMRQARYASESAKKAELYRQAEKILGQAAKLYDTVIARCETCQDEKLDNRAQRARLQLCIAWGCALREHAEIVSGIEEQVALYRTAEEMLGVTLSELEKFKGEDDEIEDDLQATSSVYANVLLKLWELLQKQAENAKTAEEKAELKKQAAEYKSRADDFIRKFMGVKKQPQASDQDAEKTGAEVDEPLMNLLLTRGCFNF